MLSSFILSKKISNSVNLRATLSFLSCTNSAQNIPETDQNASNSVEFDVKIQFLRNKLYPDNLIKVLRSTSDISSAVRIFKWAASQKRFVHTADTYYWMILKLGMAGNVDELQKIFQNMVKDRCVGLEHVLDSLVHLFVRECRLKEAICVLVQMNLVGYKPTIDVFNFVLGALVKEKSDFLDVVFVYKEMVRVGVSPTTDTLNFLLEVLFETGRIDYALDQYRRMNKKGCSPNSRTFEIVIKGIIGADRAGDSIVILNEMLELGVLPEFSFYASVIPLFCKENRLEEGLRLYKMMRASNLQPDSFIFSCLMDCLCKNLQLHDALKLLEEMRESSLTLASNVLVDVIYGFCRIGKIKEAIKFLEDKCILETSPYNALLEGCCNMNEFFTAKDLLEKMCERNIANCDSWNIVIRWLCEKVKIRKAYELVCRMIVSSLNLDRATYSALVVGNCRLSNYKNALQLFHQLRGKCWLLGPVAYSELIEGLCKGEKYQEAEDVFCYMSTSKCSLQLSSFDMLMNGICDAGKITEAVRLHLVAYGSGTGCSDAAHNRVLLGLSKLERGNYLLPFLSRMLVSGCSIGMEAYCILIQVMITENKLMDSVLFFNTMMNNSLLPDSCTLRVLLSYLGNHSRLHLISAGLAKLVSQIELLDPAMHNILINWLWKEGNKREASLLLDSMLEKGWVPDAATHTLLIGSSYKDQTGAGTLKYEHCLIKDNVSDILAEGLET